MMLEKRIVGPIENPDEKSIADMLNKDISGPLNS